ncbi:F-box domain-containing protein [Mycena chlorophos]|uniref:F-box domain-containing protein n=1 Tax=Mycena chlorophos TaxID=658473 RepID=A0A8H6WAP5_MYCCL|nr:F-box domain-containing protein [Mycena chlorophos]
MAFIFKLSKPGGLTRRVQYTQLPTWQTLAGRVSELFHIPLESVGVAYIDLDGDEVTFSTEDELNEFYLSNGGQQTVRLSVVDLSARDDEEKSLPETPRTHNRNTFGDVDTEEGWDALGGIFVSSRPDIPHAFIQPISSESNDDSDHSTTDFGGPITSTLDKGKGRATDETPAPSVVEVEEDVASIRSRNEPVVFEATATAAPVPAAEQANKDDPTDPPVPTLDETPVHTAASLPNDVAALLTTLTDVLAAHPELSEGLRNIVTNATNGTYWNSHRASMSQAAGEFMQTTGAATEDLRRQAEEEAGRRVAEALGGVVRSLSGAFAGIGGAPSAAESTAGPSTEDIERVWRTSTPTTEPVNSTSFWYGPPMFGAMRGMRGGRGGRGGRHAWGHTHHHHIPPPPPPHGPGLHQPPPGPPPFMGPWGHGRWGPQFPPPPGPPPPQAAPAEAPPSTKPTAQELRAQVEAAKAAYKREKERYRAEREERRKAHEARLAASATVANAETVEAPKVTEKPTPAPEPATEPVLVSNGNPKVGYPPLEMYSVPHRHNTYHGQPSRRRVPESAAERSLGRITKRLAAMGITENGHPDLSAKIKKHLPEGNLSDEAEQNIVSTLVEELVFMSPRPVASGSGSKQNADVPGAWL